MGKVGFIDFSSKDSGDIYVFSGSRGRYEFERVIGYNGDSVSPRPDIADISDFFLSLPAELLNFRLVKVPFSDKEKLLKVIPFELEGLMMESPDRVVFDAAVLGGAGDQFDVLVTCIGKGVLQDILNRLGLLHIDPQIVTCLELQSVIKGGAEDIASRLMSPERLGQEERIKAAKAELSGETINLRTGPLAYTRNIEKIVKQLSTATVLLLLLLLLVDSYLAFRIITVKSETSAVRKDIRNTYAVLFPGEKKITDELYQMKSHMKEIREKGNALIGVNPLQFLLDMSQRTVPGVSVNEISLDKEIVTIKGEASSMADIDKTKSRLADFLANVSVTDIKQISAGKHLFSVTAKGQR